MELKSIKDCYRIDRAWHDLGLPGQSGKCCRSPFPEGHKNGDANHSFSVFADRSRWKDQATGEGGDVFDLVAKARGCAISEAIGFVKERLGVAPSHFEEPAKRQSRIPLLRRGSNLEMQALANRRAFSIESLHLAVQRGLLRFCQLWGPPAWCVKDSRNQLYEFRRLDGEKWPAFGRLRERKSHCIGSGKAWPLGTLETNAFPKVAFAEGAPDLLAVFHHLLVEDKVDQVAPVAVLGSANHKLSSEALTHFHGKQICLFPHLDPGGRQAVRSWAQQLKASGALRVTAFDLSGLVLMDGRCGKDLADVCQISAECFDREPKFQELLP